MASAFANNTQHMNSSDKISNSKAKTNYNYLRLVSKQSSTCLNPYITSSSGNVVLKTKKKIVIDEQISDQEPKYIPISQLVRASSYELLRSINKGYYLPTSIPKGEINRPPYTYGEKCVNKKKSTMKPQNPNTSGDLQDILFNEYLDFGNLTLITNTKFKSSDLPILEDTFITKINDGSDNELQIIDASFGDYIIDPDNILNNFKDCDLSTYLGLENKSNIEGDTINPYIVQWKQINTSNFPSNKYKKFGSNKPIFFYDYDKCSSD